MFYIITSGTRLCERFWRSAANNHLNQYRGNVDAIHKENALELYSFIRKLIESIDKNRTQYSNNTTILLVLGKDKWKNMSTTLNRIVKSLESAKEPRIIKDYKIVLVDYKYYVANQLIVSNRLSGKTNSADRLLSHISYCISNGIDWYNNRTCRELIAELGIILNGREETLLDIVCNYTKNKSKSRDIGACTYPNCSKCGKKMNMLDIKIAEESLCKSNEVLTIGLLHDLAKTGSLIG